MPAVNASKRAAMRFAEFYYLRYGDASEGKFDRFVRAIDLYEKSKPWLDLQGDAAAGTDPEVSAQREAPKCTLLKFLEHGQAHDEHHLKAKAASATSNQE